MLYEVITILNITEDHLQRHGTMEEYIRCKKNIFINQTENDFLVLNYDDPPTREIVITSYSIHYTKLYDIITTATNIETIRENASMLGMGKPGAENVEYISASEANAYSLSSGANTGN